MTSFMQIASTIISLHSISGYSAATFLDVDSYKNVVRWARAIDARPAVQRGRMVNRTVGEPSMQLHERHDASDFEHKTQDVISS